MPGRIQAEKIHPPKQQQQQHTQQRFNSLYQEIRPTQLHTIRGLNRIESNAK